MTCCNQCSHIMALCIHGKHCTSLGGITHVAYGVAHVFSHCVEKFNVQHVLLTVINFIQYPYHGCHWVKLILKMLAQGIAVLID